MLHFLSIALLCLASLSAKEKQNVVILFTDDQGTLDATCYGSKDLKTPNLDQLAATGVRFTQAYAHSFMSDNGHSEESNIRIRVDDHESG